ncbi:MAG TPA: ParB/RepB/Spo0J family partition protein [Burkholderiales bacterium]|jgi:ParB family chromosome partitioning protein|nr:ParB/RepB/Spo0J family partition protein [Burkholderiales bacterium]
MIKQKGLGRGLDALLGGEEEEVSPGRESLATARVERLQPGRYQPRTKMDEASLNELAASIKAQGLMQPILVRPVAAERYEIIAGERRWRAARLAGLQEVPVVVRDVTDQAALAMALIENIQRENLNPLEEAQGVQRLVDEFKLTHQEAADAIGRSRAATTNLLRLLNLTKAVQALVFDGKLEMGHARALLALDGERQIATAKKIAAKGHSVRETEQLVNDILHPHAKAARPKARTSRDIQRLEEEVAEKLGTGVEIKPGKKGSGKLVINYMSHEHLDDLLHKLTG